MDQTLPVPSRHGGEYTPMARLCEGSDQAALWSLLGRQTEAYTMGESSSVPWETAQELLRSVLYVAALSPAACGGLEERFRQGLARARTLTARGQAMYRGLLRSLSYGDNLALQDTLVEIGLFFRRYDPRFFAHDIPCSIDYPLCHPAPDEPGGILFILEYLRRLALENRILAALPPAEIPPVLHMVCPEPREQLVNLVDCLLPNLLGGALLGRSTLCLRLERGDLVSLRGCFNPWEEAAARDLLESAARSAGEKLGLREDWERDYLLEAARDVLPRLRAAAEAGDPCRVFASMPVRPSPPCSDYVDGPRMEDSMLRALITQLQDCPDVEGKLLLVRQQVRSLADLAAVLDAAFWEEEYARLFPLLTGADRVQLLRTLCRRHGSGADFRTLAPGWGRALAAWRGPCAAAEG